MTQSTIDRLIQLGSRPRAVLVGVQLEGVATEDLRASLAELGRLVDTLGFDVVGEVTQKRPKLSPAAALGAGKLKVLAEHTGGTGTIPSGAKKKLQKKDLHKPSAEPIDDDDDEDNDDEDGASKPAPKVKATVVVVDNELSPSQLRNLERATGVEVLDRAGVIIEIFHRHARTKEAQLQVEIARLQYEAPRMREKDSSGDRQRGDGHGGKGDDDVELDRRRIRDRIAELKEELEEQTKEAATRRKRRRDAMRIALVGYTNAGKSSLMRALTGHDVLVADKLFATLGTTVRAIHPQTHPRILVSDTVGFIKSLPHGLVASFRSTLDEANEASLLLFVVDASDPACRAQLAVTRSVISELGAKDLAAKQVPSMIILNKCDRLDALERKSLLLEFPHAVAMSALDDDDVKRLYGILVQHFEDGMEEATLLVPYSKQGAIGAIRESARVVKEDWEQDGLKLLLRAPHEDMARLRSLLIA